jgi:hypothetical protein
MKNKNFFREKAAGREIRMLRTMQTPWVKLLMLGLMVGALVLTACAPEDLDITPIPTATEVPPPTPTREASVAAADDDVIAANQGTLDAILAAVPGQMPAGAVIWRRDNQREMQAVTNIDNGVGMKVFFNEQTGGTSTLTFAVFNTPEDATVYYDFIQGLREVLRNGEPMENLPTPNLAGSGLYGSNAIFQLDNIFVEVSIELFSSTQGNPLPALSRETIRVVETALSSVPARGGEEATEEPAAEATSEASAATGGNQAKLDGILAALPPLLQASVEWRRDSDAAPELETIDADPNAVTGSWHYTTASTGDAIIFISVFDDAEGAQAFFDAQHELHETLRRAEPNDNFPEPNVFAGGTYGWAALLRVDNVVIRLSVPRISSTLGDPLPSLMRLAMQAVESAS